MLKAVIFLSAVLVSNPFVLGQVPVPMASQPGLTYTEDFQDIEFWGDNFSSGIGANRFRSVPVNATGTIPDGVRTTVSSAAWAASTTTGGMQKGSLSGNPVGSIVLLSTGVTSNTNAVAFEFLMDFTGVVSGTLSFDWRSVNNSTGNRIGSMRVYWSIDNVSFTEIPAAAVLDFVNNSVSTGNVNVPLPGQFSNSPTAVLRFYEYNGSTAGTTGSRPKISIDNLTVTAVEPTAASVAVGGRVMTADGRGIGNVRVAVEGFDLPSPRYALTNPFGYYRIDRLEAGLTYMVSVASKRHSFAEPVRIVTLNGKMDDVNFIADP